MDANVLDMNMVGDVAARGRFEESIVITKHIL
jgi:hypothetical protein